MKAERPIVIEGDVVFVTLTRGKVAVIDAADVDLVRGGNWQAMPRHDGLTFYAARTETNPTRHLVQMHRLISGALDGEEPDHRDGDGLNNRRVNLRVGSKADNQKNRRHTSNMHGLKGVYWDGFRDKFGASITVDGKRKMLGRFPTKEDAGRAYDAAAIRCFGDLAATNAEAGRL